MVAFIILLFVIVVFQAIIISGHSEKLDSLTCSTVSQHELLVYSHRLNKLESGLQSNIDRSRNECQSAIDKLKNQCFGESREGQTLTLAERIEKFDDLLGLLYNHLDVHVEAKECSISVVKNEKESKKKNPAKV